MFEKTILILENEIRDIKRMEEKVKGKTLKEFANFYKGVRKELNQAIKILQKEGEK